MSDIKPRPVMVTGATGYIASWVVRRLLETGFHVHAAAPGRGFEHDVNYLTQIADQTPGKLNFFAGNLLQAGSFADAMKGCGAVFHTTSQLPLDQVDSENEWIEAAQRATRNIIHEVQRQPSVRRVVLTSSCAAVYGDNIDLRRTQHGEFTEQDWNTTSSPRHQARAYRRTLTEREAWRISGVQSRWDLIVLNPTLVLGPSISPNVHAPSFSLLKKLGDGSLRWGVPDYELGVVDVRDLADAHVRAADVNSPSGRCIICGHNTSLLNIAKRLHERFSLQFPIPRWTLPKPLVWLFGPLLDKSLTRRVISRNVGYPFFADNTKSIELLGMQYRRLDDTVCDMFQQMINFGMLGSHEPKRLHKPHGWF